MLSSYSFRRKLLCKVCFVIVAYKHNKYPLHLIVPLKKNAAYNPAFHLLLRKPIEGQTGIAHFQAAVAEAWEAYWGLEIPRAVIFQPYTDFSGSGRPGAVSEVLTVRCPACLRTDHRHFGAEGFWERAPGWCPEGWASRPPLAWLAMSLQGVTSPLRF